MRPRALSKSPSFDDSMITGTWAKRGVALDDGAGLVAVKPRHQDVAEDELGVVVVDLGQRVETVLGQHHFVPALAQEDLCAATDGIAVVDDQHLGAFRARVRPRSLQAPPSSITPAHSCTQRKGSDRHHLEVFLARTALWACPVHRDIGPCRSRRNAMLGVAIGLGIYPAADQAHPGCRFAHCQTVTSLQWSAIVATQF